MNKTDKKIMIKMAMKNKARESEIDLGQDGIAIFIATTSSFEKGLTEKEKEFIKDITVGEEERKGNCSLCDEDIFYHWKPALEKIKKIKFVCTNCAVTIAKNLAWVMAAIEETEKESKKGVSN